MSFIKKIFKKEYSHFFVYKWGIFAGVVEALLIIFATFTLLSIKSLFVQYLGIKENTLYFTMNYLYQTIFFIMTFLIVFGMPIYLIFKKKMYSTAISVLFVTTVTLFLFFTVLLLISIM